MNEMSNVEEAVKIDTKTDKEKIESMYTKESNVVDECSLDNLMIQNNVNNIKTTNMGGDDDYNPGF